MFIVSGGGFCISWEITNFLMCPFKPNHTLLSPVFTAKILGRTKWRLVLHLKNQQFPDHIGFFLKRESCDSGIDSITVDLRFSISNKTLGFQTVRRELSSRIFHEGAVAGCEDILVLNEYPAENEDDTQFCCEIHASQNRTERITFKDEITFNHHLGDFQQLSQALGNLIPSVFNPASHPEYVADLILICDGQSFKVHRPILAARCPAFLDAIASDPSEPKMIRNMPASCLKSILWYIYTGELKMETLEIPRKLYKAAVRYGMSDFIEVMEEIALCWSVRTKFRVETHNLEWFVDKIGKFRELVRVVRTETIYIRGVTVMLDVRPNSPELSATETPELSATETPELSATKTPGKHFILKICLQSFKYLKPVFVSVNTYIKTNLQDGMRKRMAFSDRHLFETDECWSMEIHPPEDDSFIPRKFVFFCDIEICDGEELYNSIRIEVDDSIQARGGKDYFKLSRDVIQLLSSETLSDVKITVRGGREFRVHKVVLGALSSVFRSMFSCDMSENQKGEVSNKNAEPEIMELLLSYLYSGTVKNLDFADAFDLYKVADYYDVTHLKEICTDFMLSEGYLNHLAEVYQLAGYYKDVKMKENIAAIMKAKNITVEMLQVND